MTTRKDDEDTLEMLRLYCTEDQSYAEIAKTTGIAQRTVAKRIQRVRHQDFLHDPAEAAAYWNNLPKGTPT
mgnify:FL=1